MSGFRIDHLDGPRFDRLSGTYYGEGSTRVILPSARKEMRIAPRALDSWKNKTERERKTRKVSERK